MSILGDFSSARPALHRTSRLSSHQIPVRATFAQILHAASPSNVLMEPAGHWSTWPAHQVPFHLDDVIMGFPTFLFFHFPLRSWPFVRISARMWCVLPGFPGRRRSSSLTAIFDVLDAAGNTIAVVCDCIAIVFSRAFFLVVALFEFPALAVKSEGKTDPRDGEGVYEAVHKVQRLQLTTCSRKCILISTMRL